MLSRWAALSLICSTAVAIGVPTRVGAEDTTHPPGHRHFQVEQVKNPNGARNGPAEYAFAHTKYGLPVPDGLAKAMTASKAGWGEIPAWNQQYDMEYLSPVFVGDPPQMVFLNFDTGSADTWMYSSETQVGHINGQRFYSPADSKFSQRLNGSWHIRYGDGSFATGTVYKDVMALGDVLIPNMTIQTATRVSSMMTADLNMSGLAGLCANHPSTVRPRQPALLDLLEPILDEYVFTADLRYHDTGRYRFGRVPAEDYEGEIVYVPTNASSLYWEFNLSGIHIEGTNTWYFYDWPMIADTGTTLMLMPPDLAKMYWDRVEGAEYSVVWDSWSFPCNQTDSLPDWEFEINGFRAVVPGHYMNYQNLTAEHDMCYGGLQPFPPELGFGILGDVFLKAIYAVFDVRNKQIGFAKKKLWA